MSLLDNLLSRVGYIKYSNGDSFYRQGNTSFYNKATMEIALSNPVLFSCIEIRAKSLSKVRFYQEDAQGEEITDSKIVERLKNPNSFQSQQDFLKQYEWYKTVYGYVYQKPYRTAIDKELKAIFNLNTAFVEFPKEFKTAIIFSDKDVREFEEQKIKYKEPNQNVREFKLKEILPFFDVANSLTKDDNKAITSPSRVNSILKNLSNIKLSTNAENIMIQQNGREIFWSSGKGGNLGSTLPMDAEDKKSIQRVINSTGFGASKNRAIVGKRELGHKSLHINLKDLGLHDVITNNAELVRSVLEIPSEVYDAFTKNKTYENQKEAEIGFYQNTMQPIADDLASTYTNVLGLETPLKASFSHLPVMQHTEEKKANKILKIAMAYEKLQHAGMSEEGINDLFISQGLNSLQDE